MARYVDLVFRANTAAARAELRALGVESSRVAAAAETAWARTTRRIQHVGTAVQSTGRTMTGLGIGMGAIGYVSVKAAMNFQTAMTRIQTQAGLGKKQVDLMSAAVLKLGGSGKVQYGPTDLANALYHIESVGVGTYKSLQQTSVAMNVLRIAAQGAAVGGSNLEDTTTALMGVLFATRTPISQAAKEMGLINATVGAGNMRLQDLVQALGRGVIPAFKQVGLTATDAFAAIALLADSGVKASSGASQLGTALHFLVTPSAKADKFLTFLHMSSTQMAEDLHKPHGLLVGLRDLADHLKKLPGGITGTDAGQVVASILPGGRGRVLLTVLQNLDRYGNKIEAIYKQQGKFGDDVKAQSRTLSGQLHTAWAKINTDLTIFGATLVPIISHYMPMFLHDIERLIGFFTGLPAPVKNFLVLATAAFAVGGPIVWGIGKMISLLAVLRRAWIAIRAAAIAAGIAEAGAGAAGAGGAAVGGAAAAGRMAPWMVPGGPAWAKAAPVAKASRLSRILGTFGRATQIGFLGYGLASILNGFGTPDKDAPRITGAHGQKYYNPRVEPFTHGARGGFVTSKGIRHYDAGGYVGTDSVTAGLTIGEGVLNRTAMAGIGGERGLSLLNHGDIGSLLGGMSIQSAPVYVVLDGRVIARSVLQQTLRKAARGPTSLVGGALTTGVSAPVSR